MSKIQVQSKNIEQIYQRIKEVLINARSRAWQAVNTAMVASYWEIGRIIIEEEQKGKARAEYGSYLLDSCKKLTGIRQGFDEATCKNEGILLAIHCRRTAYNYHGLITASF